MTREYNGHSTKFTLKVENIPFGEGLGNQPDQDAVFALIKD